MPPSFVCSGGGDTSGNSTVFLGQTDAAFYILYNNQPDERGNTITDSLPSGGGKSHYETRTGTSTSSSSQNMPLLLIICPPHLDSSSMSVCLSALSEWSQNLATIILTSTEALVLRLCPLAGPRFTIRPLQV